MLTNSCVKLQTVHTIPMTMNKEGEVHNVLPFFRIYGTFNIRRVLCFILTCIMWTLPSTDDESSGLYGFLNVIVHSASGLKQSLSKWLALLFLMRNHLSDNSRGCTWCHVAPPTLSRLWPSTGTAAAGEHVGLARNTVYKPPQICLAYLVLSVTKGSQAIVSGMLQPVVHWFHSSFCYFFWCHWVILEL